MKKILVYDDDVSGHHLEYLNHIHNILANRKESVVMVVPESFNSKKDLLKWTSCTNIIFYFLSNEEVSKTRNGGYFLTAWNRSKIIGKYVRQFGADELFLNTLCHPFPFLPFSLPSKTRVSGIIYRIHLYELSREGIIAKIKDVIENFVIAHSSKTKHPLLLNSPGEAERYNRHYNVNKYRDLPDPVIPFPYASEITRTSLGIKDEDIVFLQFGYLDERKGILQILKSIQLLTKDELEGKSFIFAGKVSPAIRVDYYSLVESARGKGANIVMRDEFCSYEFLGSLCEISDYYMVPYSNISYSSGVVGHAAYYGKRLIGPSVGVLGNLLKLMDNTIFIKDSSPGSIAAAIKESVHYIPKVNQEYLNRNSQQCFQKEILKAIIE